MCEADTERRSHTSDLTLTLSDLTLSDLFLRPTSGSVKRTQAFKGRAHCALNMVVFIPLKLQGKT